MIFKMPTWDIISVLPPIPFSLTGGKSCSLQFAISERYSGCANDTDAPVSIFTMILSIILLRPFSVILTLIRASVMALGYFTPKLASLSSSLFGDCPRFRRILPISTVKSITSRSQIVGAQGRAFQLSDWVASSSTLDLSESLSSLLSSPICRRSVFSCVVGDFGLILIFSCGSSSDSAPSDSCIGLVLRYESLENGECPKEFRFSDLIARTCSYEPSLKKLSWADLITLVVSPHWPLQSCWRQYLHTALLVVHIRRSRHSNSCPS